MVTGKHLGAGASAGVAGSATGFDESSAGLVASAIESEGVGGKDVGGRVGGSGGASVEGGVELHGINENDGCDTLTD